MEDDSKAIQLCQSEYGQSKTRLTCVATDEIPMVPLSQIWSRLLPTVSRQTLEKRIKQLGDVLIRRKANQDEALLLKDGGAIPRKCVPPWLVPRSNLEDVVPFLACGDLSLLKKDLEEQNSLPNTGRPDDVKRRLARALGRLESDFHDSSPLSVKSISSSTGVRASSMRAGFFTVLNQEEDSTIDKQHSTVEELNGIHPFPSPDLEEISRTFEHNSFSDVAYESDIASDYRKEASDVESIASNEATIAISNDCNSTPVPVSHCLWDYVDVDENCDLVLAEELMFHCSSESKDPDFTLHKQGKKRVQPGKMTRRRKSDDKESKWPGSATCKIPKHSVKAIEADEGNVDHAAMKREYDAQIQQLNDTSVTELSRVKVVIPRATLEASRRRQKAKQLLDRAHKVKVMSQQKQPIKPVAENLSVQVPAGEPLKPVGPPKPVEVMGVRKIKKFQPVSTCRHNFCLQDAIPSHPLLVIGDDDELDVRYEGHLKACCTANELPPLCHPIWDWQVGQPSGDSNKRVVIRRVRLTTVPRPSQDPTKSRPRKRQLLRQGKPGVKQPSFGIV